MFCQEQCKNANQVEEMDEIRVKSTHTKNRGKKRKIVWKVLNKLGKLQLLRKPSSYRSNLEKRNVLRHKEARNRRL